MTGASLPGRGSIPILEEPGGGAAITFAGILYCNLWPEMDDQCDEPPWESFNAWPEPEGIVRELTRDLKRPMKGSAAFLLSPTVWRRFGRDSARVRSRGEIPIPASCLAVWPVLSLRCHIAHALVRRRPKAWLFFAVRNSLTRLALASRPQTTLRLPPI